MSCDTAENARECKFEIFSWGVSDSSGHIDLEETETKKRLKLAEILIPPGAGALTQSDIRDYRNDVGVCGYVKCILGKCTVYDEMMRIDAAIHEFDELKSDVRMLQNKIADIGDITQMNLSTPKIPQN
ncbi:MAG: hypothetical protein NC320_09140 [Clostridium sp.]|nr:hypothetical protein [Clostridium sp.]